MNIVKPDYNRSVLSISSSIMKYYNVDSNYQSLKELDDILSKKYRNIVYLIIDGLGYNIMRSTLSNDSFLNKHTLTSVTTVLPSSTVPATTAIHSGLSPLESGWIGWMQYIKENNCMLEMFSGRDFYTRKVIEDNSYKEDLKYTRIYDLICSKNSDINFHLLFPEFAPNGSKTFEELCGKIEYACNNKEHNLISAYWDEFDTTMHEFGVGSKESFDVLTNINKNLEELTKKLDDTLIIITADHGQVNIKEIYLNDYPDIDACLKMPPSIEFRFVTFFIKDGMHEEFVKSLDKHFNGKCILYTKEEFLNSGLLGMGVKHKRIDDFFGDYVLISTSNLSFSYTTTGKKDKPMVANHGGILEDEMLVPVICIECK